MTTTKHAERPSRTSARRSRGEAGTAMLETAIAIPLLLLVLFGIFELGLAFARAQVLSNAAREGAREASLFRTTCNAADVRGRVDNAVQQTGSRLGMSNLTVTLTNECVPGQRVRVRVQFTHELPVVSGLTRLLGGSGAAAQFPLTAQAEMLNEAFQSASTP